MPGMETRENVSYELYGVTHYHKVTEILNCFVPESLHSDESWTVNETRPHPRPQPQHEWQNLELQEGAGSHFPRREYWCVKEVCPPWR